MAELFMAWLTTLPAPSALWRWLTGGVSGDGMALMGWQGIFALVTALVGFLAHWLLRALFPTPPPAARGALFLVAFLVAVAAGAAAGFTLGSLRPIH